MSTGSEKDVVSDRVQRLLGIFVQQMRAGKVPDVAEYCVQAGDEASMLEPMLRTLLSLETLREVAVETLTLESFRPTPPPARIGDFQLMRMVGRGGMGVVYEAVEMTLGRRVAIKLLENRHAADPRSIKRFVREAQAAARLHHTNILPVFASGEDAGIRYYVMQFVDGCTLSQWIQHMRSAVESDPASTLTGKDLTAYQESYQTQYRALATEPPADHPEGNVAEGNGAEGNGAAHKPRPVRKDASYYRRVAEIGLQIAEALEHAAAQGVLHRDVKPSNVMLGLDSSVWVMDFGLATVQQAENLTESGEVLGTLRYMAPERLNGQHTLHGDMYGLGMILYELIGLRPAFDASERSGLRHQVALATPTALRNIDDRVPFDLETIVMKCIAASPQDRYRDMPELINDLSLYLRDRPIASRRTSLAVHCWRWSKRNPLTSLLISATAALLVILAFGSFLWAQSLRRERNVALAAEAKALASEQLAVESSLASRRAERSSQAALELARRTEQQRKLLLFRTLVEEMRSAFDSGSSGQRLRGLQAAEELLAIIPWREMTEDQQRELRDAAIACLSVADTELVSSTSAMGPLTASLDVDPSLSVLATHDGSHNTQILALDGMSDRKTLSTGRNTGVFHSARLFSPCGRWLYEGHHSHNEESNGIRLWDWQSGELILEIPNPAAENEFCFDNLGQNLYVVQAAAISVYELPSGRLVRTSAPQFRNSQLAISANGTTLACISRTQPPCLLNPETFQVIEMLPEIGQASSASWDPVHGDLLIGADGPEVLVWNPSHRLIHRHPVLKSDSVTSIQLDRIGRTLAVRGRGFSEIMNRGRGALSIGIVGYVVRVGTDGQRLAVHRSNQVEIHRLVQSNFVTETSQGFSFAKFSPDGQSLAASGAAGVKILDAKTLTTVADLGLDFCGPAIWNPTVNELSTFGTFSHLCRWKVDTERVVNGETEIKTQPVAIQKFQPIIGPPQPVQIDPRRAKMGLDSRIPQHQGRFSVWHPSGKWLYFVDYRNHIVYQMDPETGDCEELVKLDNPVSLDISPDGRWLAIGRILTDRVSLLDLASRQVIAELPHLNQPKFSFDGKYLVGSNFEEVRVYSTADWQLARRWHAETLNRFISINIALSPRSNLLAAAVSDSKVRLFDLETGDEFSDISLQRSDPITWLEFDSRCQRLAIVRESSLSVWDLAQLGSELKSLGLDAPFLPTVSADEIPAQDNSHLVWSVDRGADLLAADRWWTGYQILAIFEAMSKNYADAIDNMDKALATVQHVDHPSRAAVLVRRAKYHLASQNAHQALSDLRMAQKLQPKEPGVIRELGKLLIEGPVEIRNIPQGQLLLEQLVE